MNSDNTLHAGLFRNNRNYALFSSFRETNRGALIGIQTPDHVHQLNYEFSWRDITPVYLLSDYYRANLYHPTCIFPGNKRRVLVDFDSRMQVVTRKHCMR